MALASSVPPLLQAPSNRNTYMLPFVDASLKGRLLMRIQHDETQEAPGLARHLPSMNTGDDLLVGSKAGEVTMYWKENNQMTTSVRHVFGALVLGTAVLLTPVSAAHAQGGGHIGDGLVNVQVGNVNVLRNV